MATYQGIKGRTVQNLASDPPASVGEGQIWYNTASDTLKVSVGLGAWASGTSLPTPMTRYSFPGFGTQDAGAIVGGYDTSGSPATPSQTNLYDGTTWTDSGTAAFQSSESAASGTQTAAFNAGGYGPGSYVATSQTFDGSTWTAQGSMVDGGRGLHDMAGGTQTAGAVCGSHDAGNTSHETFDGSTWTAATDMNVAHGGGGGAGTQTALLIMAGGYPNTATIATTEEWNGSSWAAGGTLGTARSRCAGGPTGGSYNNGWLGGGNTNPPTTTGVTETYDGTSWTEAGAMATARIRYGSFGTNTAAVVAGGDPSATAAAVEEFNLAGTIQTITSS